MKRRHIVYMAFVLLLCAVVGRSEVKLPALISSHMVLQQGMKVTIWGWAAPQESVQVTFRDQKQSTTAGADGRWSVRLSPLKPGGPDDLTITGSNKLVIQNVLVGEVWVCSGQSNMQMMVSDTGVAAGRPDVLGEDYPQIRMFTVKRAVAGQPQHDAEGQWVQTSPLTVGKFSAVGYYFGRELHKVLNVPVGLIHTSWGGTPAESWTSRAALQAEPELRPLLERGDRFVAEAAKPIQEFEQKWAEWKSKVEEAEAKGAPIPEPPQIALDRRGDAFQRPSGLFNGMIAPLVNYAIRGAIWYQGESNAPRATEYRQLFPTMIRDWRRAWGQGEFPFLFVQLANFQYWGLEYSWPLLREAQTMTLSLPKTGMAVTVDIGESRDIHPRNKLEVGRRLSLAARALAYGEKIDYSGPIFKSMTIEGEKVRIHFDYVGSGLVGKYPYGIKGFEVAGEDRKFFATDGKIEGRTVVVQQARVPRPVAVRYAWRNDPQCDLYNQAGLPASPFRTDDWPMENGAM